MSIQSREQLRQRLNELLARVKALHERAERLAHEKKVLLLTWQERWAEVKAEVVALRALTDRVLSYDGEATRVGRPGPHHKRSGRS